MPRAKAAGLTIACAGAIVAVRRLANGAVMLGALSTGIRSVLWAVTFVLAIILVAALVAPVSTAENMASWLTYAGLPAQANWLIAHSQTGIHLSLQPLVHIANVACTRNGCVFATEAFAIDLSEIALIGAAGIVACAALLLLLPVASRFLRGLKPDWLDHDTHVHHGRA